MREQDTLEKIARRIRSWILTSTTTAGSGHPTSSLSATDLMAALFFGGFFRFDVAHPEYANNDRLIFSKGHAAPLFYALWAAANAMPAEELMTLRKFGSRLEGHPSMAFPYTETATGSLGQGLSVGVGMAMNAKYVDHLPYRTYVLLGDSEMAEGSVWEAMEIAAHYQLDNLVGILDLNRLGQRGQTMYAHECVVYERRAQSFGWETIVIDGHNVEEIIAAYAKALTVHGKPVMIIAKTLKGKGISFIEDKEGWHGKTLSAEELQRALRELGGVDTNVRGVIAKPEVVTPSSSPLHKEGVSPRNARGGDPSATLERSDGGRGGELSYPHDKPVATRKAYGNALVRIFPQFPDIVVLDAEVSNSTYAEIFKQQYPDRFFEMYVAEQNMVGTALGFSRRGKIPFVSTFAAFLTRAFDQIRMSQYADANIKFVGSHAGVSIGEDGPSQMALEDIAMFRAAQGSVVLYPADAIATERLVEVAAAHRGNVYIRTTRKETPILYTPETPFVIGGSHVVKKSAADVVTVVGAGVTLYEALAAHELLAKEGIAIRVIDAYSVKPIDAATLAKAAKETKAIITVEDHVPEGGLGEAVLHALADTRVPVLVLAVTKIPKSGKPDELLAYEGINAAAIVAAVRLLA